MLPVSAAASPGASRPEWVLRIISAVVLATAALGLGYASPHAFAVLITIFITAMAWEWGRLVRGNGLDPVCGAQFAATAAAAWLTVENCLPCAFGALLAGMGAVFVLRLMDETTPRTRWSAAGVLYAGLPAIALIWIRCDTQLGWLAILYIFLIVWTTDTAAYLFGRTIGGPKLAPRISPKKTWAGFLGGTLSAAGAGALFGLWIGGTDLAKLGLLSFGFACVAQFGDLGESALKRSFGIKDSSQLIPGHGGVLDRIDGLVFVAIAAAIMAWAIDAAQPGRAILVWS